MDNCTNCPVRLYNSKHHNLQGYGNPWSPNVIIIPNVDYDAYKEGDLSYSKQVEVLSAILSTGVFSTSCFITPLIRCSETISCSITDDIIKNCLNYLAVDLKTYNWRNILVCGNAWQRLFSRQLETDFTNVIYSVKNKRLYTPNYNPLIKYIDDTKFEIFKNRLLEWYNDSVNCSIPRYEILYL